MLRLDASVVSVVCLVFALGHAASVGCGGKVVFDGDPGAGEGGAGGASPQTTSIVVGPGSTSISVGPSTSVTVGPGPSTTVSTGVSTTSVGPSMCDGQGDCGDEQNGCIGCALKVSCGDEYDTCVDSDECIAYSTCLGECGGPPCFDQCNMQYPQGAAEYAALLDCVFCEQCPTDCPDVWNCFGN